MSNLKIKYFDDLADVEKTWNDIFSRSSSSYFCSVKWHQVVISLFRAKRLTSKINKLKYFTLSSKPSGKVELVGFFYLTRFLGKSKIRFTHLVNFSDYYDFVCSEDFEFDLIPEIFRKIAFDCKAAEIQINHLNSFSGLIKPLQEDLSYQVSTLKCVAVHLEDDYELYLKTISKSVRQNLRTAQNRVIKNNLNFGYRLLTNKDCDRIDFQMLKDLYSQRNQQKNSEKVYWKTKISRFLDYGFSQEKDMFEIAEIKDTDFTLGLLYLDQNLVSYFFGFRSNSGIEINRVVINDKFRFYSPGLLLLNEYIKQEIPKGLKTFDLTLGDEKYKYDLAGKEHHVYNFHKSIL